MMPVSYTHLDVYKRQVYEEPGTIGSFRFCLIRKTLAPESDVEQRERHAIAMKYAIDVYKRQRQTLLVFRRHPPDECR